MPSPATPNHVAVLSEYPALLLDSPQFATVAGGFSGAIVWKVTTAGSAFALRRWPPGSATSARLNGLHRLLRHLVESEVGGVACPLTTSAGRTVVLQDGAMWHLEPWMPGEANFHADPRPERLESAMRALARWHVAAATFRPRAGEREWFEQTADAPSPAVAQRLSLVTEWTTAKLARLAGRLEAAARSPVPGAYRPIEPGTLWVPESAPTFDSSDDEFLRLAHRIVRSFALVAPRVAQELTSLRQTRYRLQPCLRDVWHDHVLFTGDEVTGLIDPSACRSENVATDLARALGSLIGDAAALWTRGIEAYRSAAPFDDAEFALCRTLDHSGVALSPMTWLERRYLRNERIPNEAAVVLRLRAMAERLDHLAGISASRDDDAAIAT